MGELQFQKFPLMSAAINSGGIHTVKALQATGVPLPFWALPDTPPTGFRRWLRRAMLPFGRRDFRPYDPQTIRSQVMTKFLIEKGVDVNTRLVLEGGYWTPPGIGMTHGDAVDVCADGGPGGRSAVIDRARR